jgi:hypothetical protein
MVSKKLSTSSRIIFDHFTVSMAVIFGTLAIWSYKKNS